MNGLIGTLRLQLDELAGIIGDPNGGGNTDYCHGISCLEHYLRALFGNLNGPSGGLCAGPSCFGPLPPPPPAWAVNHKRPDPTCTGGCVTHGTTLPTVIEPGSAYVPQVAASYRTVRSASADKYYSQRS